MSVFEPKNPNHAISAAAFQLNFSQQLNIDAIERAKAIESSVKEFLPGVSTFPEPPPPVLAALRGRSIAVPLGIVFQRVDLAGSPLWLLTAQQNVISAQCTDYTRWDEVWGKVRIWLRDLYTKIKTEEIDLVSLSLQYIDQFIAKYPLEERALEKLFRKDTIYFPSRIFSNEELWHVNQGWYQNVNDPMIERELNILNTSTQIVGAQVVLSIDHQLRCELKNKNPPLFTGEANERTLLDEIMENLHNKNKAVLRDLLSTEAADRIHLNE